MDTSADNWQMSDEDKQKVTQIRESFKKEYESKKELYESDDYDIIKENDYSVWRYLDEKDGDADEAYQMLVKSMRWRKQMDVKNLRDTDFPRELFRIAANHIYVKDKSGLITYYNRLSLPPPPKEFFPIMSRLLVFALDIMDRIVQQTRCKFGIIIDCRNPVTQTSLDVPSMRDMMACVQGNYPSCVGYVAYYEMSAVMKAAHKMVKTFASSKISEIYLTKNNIDDIIGLENVPDYMGGTCQMPYMVDMDHCPSVQEVADRTGISQEAVDEFYQIYDKYLKDYEARREQLERKEMSGQATFL